MSELLVKPKWNNKKDLQGPRSLRVSAGRLYISDRKARVCYETRADLSDERLTVIEATTIKINDYFREPYFLYPGLDGVLYATEHLNGCIFQYQHGHPSVRAGRPGYGSGGSNAGEARFMNPRGGVVDPSNGTLYIADHANDQIRWIKTDDSVGSIGLGRSLTKDGKFEVCAFRRPSDICLHPDTGMLYVCENYTIRLLDRVNNEVKIFTGTPNESTLMKDGPPDTATLGILLSIAYSENHLFTTDTTCQKIRVVDMSGYVSTLQTPQLRELFGIAISTQGHVLYSQVDLPTIGIIPFVLDELNSVSMDMEPIREFGQTKMHSICGESFPLPLIHLAYPTLYNPSEGALESIQGDEILLKSLVSYLLNNNHRAVTSRSEFVVCCSYLMFSCLIAHANHFVVVVVNVFISQVNHE
jgi:hypothetical protein